MNLSVPTLAETKSDNHVTAPPPASLFQGYDSVNGFGVSTAVEGTSVDRGAPSTVKCHVTEDIESLYKALEINQSASVSFGPVDSLSEKAKFVKSLNLTTHCINIVVYARHIQKKEVATDPKLKGGIEPPTDDNSLCNFFRGYGDSFVSSLTTGAEYYAVYTFYSRSKEQKTSVSAELKGKGVFDGVTVETELQSKLDAVSKSTQTNMSFSQNVSGIADPKLPTPNKLVEYAIGFTSIPVDMPCVITFDSTGYEHVPQVENFQPIAKNRRYFIGDSQVSGLTADLVKLCELRTQIKWLQEIYRFYNNFTDPEVNKALGDVQSDIGKIDQQMKTYLDNPIAHFEHLSLPSLELGMPQLKYKIGESPKVGQDGPEVFDDVNINTYLQSKTRIKNLQLRTGGYVNILIVTYQSEGKDPDKKTHGTETKGTHFSDLLELLDWQFVTQISGYSGDFVDKLKITISDGRSIEGGGDQSDNAFRWDCPDDDIVLGFKGQCGGYINQIQAVYAILQPAKWEKSD